MLNAELLNMIPEMVEKYDMEIENLGDAEVLNVKNMAALQADGMMETVRHMVKDIKEYLRNSGKPVKYTPAFVPPVDGLHQNVVTTWYQAEFYNRNGCLEKRRYLAESLAAAEQQAAADAAHNNLALHCVEECPQVTTD